jgi:hypothetical protein
MVQKDIAAVMDQISQEFYSYTSKERFESS